MCFYTVVILLLSPYDLSLLCIVGPLLFINTNYKFKYLYGNESINFLIIHKFKFFNVIVLSIGRKKVSFS